MNPYGELIAADTVRFQRLLPGTIDTVWAFLVEGEKRRKWLAAGDLEQRVGGRAGLHFDNSRLSSLSDDAPPKKYQEYSGPVSYHGEVTACEPKTLLAHTWFGDDGENSEVTYELEQRDEGVLLTLTHRRLSDDVLTGVLSGWHTHLDILVDILSGREPKPFWRTHTANEAEYEERLS